MSLYFWVNLLAISIPVIASFHPRLKFYKFWKYLFPAMLIVSIPYLLWDVYFTHQGYWGFNPTYLSELYIFNLPIEEIIFFFAIPYACIFTHYSIQVLGYNLELSRKTTGTINMVVAGIALIMFFGFIQLAYTATAMVFVLIAMIIVIFVDKSLLRTYYSTYLIILVPFFIVNGVLTGTGIENEIVWYNDSENLGIRMGTIPIEDASYAFSLILLNLVLFEKLSARGRSTSTKA